MEWKQTYKSNISMETKNPWYLPSQYLTKRWQQQHPSHMNPTSFQRSLVCPNTRPQRNNRYLTTSALTNISSCPRFKVQEICLEDNKWFILDSEKEQNQVLRQLSNTVNFQQSRKKKSKQGYFPTVGKTSKSQFLKTQTSKQKIMKQKQSTQRDESTEILFTSQRAPCDGMKTQKGGQIRKKGRQLQKLQLKFTGPQEQLKIKVQGVKDSKVVEFDRKKEKSRVQGLKPPNLRERSPKSMKSVKSVKSMKSAKSMNHKNKVPSKKQTKEKEQSAKSIEIKVTEQKVPSLPESQLIKNKGTEIACLFDPTYILLGDKALEFMMDNPYNDYPEWSQYLKNDALNQSKNQPPELHIQQNAFERKKSLPLQFSSANLFSKNNYDNVRKEERQSKTSLSFNNKETKRCNSMITSTQKGQVQISLSKKQRCLTTKVTDKPPDSPHFQAFQGFEFNTPVVKEEPKQCLSQRQVRDSSFNIKQYFLPQESVNYVQIEITKQTAYYPWNLKKPIYITPNPSSSQYQNLQIITLLNLFLKVQSKSIQKIFNQFEQHFYQCNLFQEGKLEKIIVDGIFPFDSNYFSLFGFVEQYIWFPVLMKALAKKKGSYKDISAIDFQEMFSLITGLKLMEINSLLETSNEPLLLLESFLKEAKEMQTFLLVIDHHNFYKIESIVYQKSAIEKKEELEEENALKKTKMRKSVKQEVNMKSLSKFIKEQKNQITLQRMKENTQVRLLSVTDRKNVTLGDLLLLGFKIYQPVRHQIVNKNNRS